MSRFGELMSAFMSPRLLQQFGRPATYTAPATDPVSITIRMIPATSVEIDGDRGRAQQTSCRATIARSEVSSPAMGDLVTVDGVDWAVGDIENQSETFSTVQLSRLEKKRVEDQDYRKRYGR